MRLALVLLAALAPALLGAQVQAVLDPSVRTLTLTVDGDPTRPPLLSASRRQRLEVAWDEMSHESLRYVYHIVHCGRDWEPSGELFESDYLAGLNDQLVEESERSLNTTQIYTHYRLELPNERTRPLLSGNYRVRIFHEEDDPARDEPVLEARFCVYESAVTLRAAVSGDTDADFNASHQQVTLSVGYGSLPVVDPQRELDVVVTQNRRWDTRADSLVANMRSDRGVQFTHNRRLIFGAGSEFRRFEILDIHSASAGVDRMEWHEPYHHAVLDTDRPARSYTYAEDQNGVYVPRSADDADDATTAEYVVAHFTLESPRLPGGDVYVCGQWTGEPFRPDCRMEYDERRGQYHAEVLLKQGYYSYEYRQRTGASSRALGNFYETENEYGVLVYYRGQGARYDRLVGYATLRGGGR